MYHSPGNVLFLQDLTIYNVNVVHSD